MLRFRCFAMVAVCLGILEITGCVHNADRAKVSGARFVQDRFAIGFWVDPPLDSQADARYRAIADAHFSMIIGGQAGKDPALLKKQLGLCKKYDLKAVLFCGDMAPAERPDTPACWGYALRDEPSAADFSALRTQVDAVRRASPGKLAYINLLPNYATAAQLGVDTYEEYVARFVKEVGVDVLSMDHYPVFKPDVDGRDGYCETLSVMRKYSLQQGIPFWNFFNTMPYGPQTDPTEDQLRWQIYASLAHGAKGVLYFCYYTPAGWEFPKGGAIIARDDRPTRHYEQAKRLNGQLEKLGPVLMQLTSTGVYRVTAAAKASEVLAGTGIADIAPAPVDPPNDYLVGAFTHTDGRRAVLLMNYRFAYTAWPTVTFSVSPEKVVEIDKESGREVPVRDESPDMPGIQLSLDAGEGRLFLMP